MASEGDVRCDHVAHGSDRAKQCVLLAGHPLPHCFVSAKSAEDKLWPPTAADDTEGVARKLDGLDRLSRALYGRKPNAQEYLGGSDAKILHDAADALTPAAPGGVGVEAENIYAQVRDVVQSMGGGPFRAKEGTRIVAKAIRAAEQRGRDAERERAGVLLDAALGWDRSVHMRTESMEPAWQRLRGAIGEYVKGAFSAEN